VSFFPEVSKLRKEARRLGRGIPTGTSGSGRCVSL